MRVVHAHAYHLAPSDNRCQLAKRGEDDICFKHVGCCRNLHVQKVRNIRGSVHRASVARQEYSAEFLLAAEVIGAAACSNLGANANLDDAECHALWALAPISVLPREQLPLPWFLS